MVEVICQEVCDTKSCEVVVVLVRESCVSFDISYSKQLQSIVVLAALDKIRVVISGHTIQ